MSRLSRLVAAAFLVAAARSAAGQSTAEYRAQVDSLARIWRPMAAEETSKRIDSVRSALLPRDSVRVGPMLIRADSQYVALGRAAAERLVPRVRKAYGEFGMRALNREFVIRARGESQGQAAIATGIVGSDGYVVLRSSVFANEEALESSWARNAEDLVTNALGQDVGNWSGRIPIDPQDSREWSNARVELLLAPADGARRCATSEAAMCPAALGLVPVEDPAFTFYSQEQRRDVINRYGRILRRANPRDFDRCLADKIKTVCDSLAHAIPPDVVPAPLPGSVRQSFVRYALEVGGEGAFDRFARSGTMAHRIEAASRMPTDSLVTQWRARLLNARTTSTALDLTTALSSIFWVMVCACLALRSSRWR